MEHPWKRGREEGRGRGADFIAARGKRERAKEGAEKDGNPL